MAIEFLNLNLIIDRLDGNADLLRRVEGAASLVAAMSSKVPVAPAAFIVPASDSASPNTLAAGAVDQNNTARFGVVIAVRNVADKTGKKAGDDLTPIRNEVAEQLMGWRPSSTFKSITYVTGRLQGFTDGVMWWQDTYQTSMHLRKV